MSKEEERDRVVLGKLSLGLAIRRIIVPILIASQVCSSEKCGMLGFAANQRIRSNRTDTWD